MDNWLNSKTNRTGVGLIALGVIETACQAFFGISVVKDLGTYVQVTGVDPTGPGLIIGGLTTIFMRQGISKNGIGK